MNQCRSSYCGPYSQSSPTALYASIHPCLKTERLVKWMDMFILTSVQKTHWHCVMVVICSRGNSPRHSLQETSGSRARSQVGRYRAVVMAAYCRAVRERLPLESASLSRKGRFHTSNDDYPKRQRLLP